MRALTLLALTAALAAPLPALAQPADAPPPAEQKPEPKSGGAVETVGKTVGGVLGSSAGAAGGPLGSAAGGLVGQTVGKGLAGFVKKLFGGGKPKAETQTAQAAAVPPPDAIAAGVDTAAQAPNPPAFSDEPLAAQERGPAVPPDEGAEAEPAAAPAY